MIANAIPDQTFSRCRPIERWCASAVATLTLVENAACPPDPSCGLGGEIAKLAKR